MTGVSAVELAGMSRHSRLILRCAQFDITGSIDTVDVQAGDYVYADETLAAMDPYSADATLYEDP